MKNINPSNLTLFIERRNGFGDVKVTSEIELAKYRNRFLYQNGTYILYVKDIDDFIDKDYHVGHTVYFQSKIK